MTACAKCHGDPDADGPLTAPAQGDLCYTQPTEQACGSCHDDIDWTKPYTANFATMPIQLANGGCLLCHNPSGGSLPTKESHVHPLNDPALDPGVNSVITAVSGGTGPLGQLQVGQTPTVTFTLKNDAGADIGLVDDGLGSRLLLRSEPEPPARHAADLAQRADGQPVSTSQAACSRPARRTRAR